MFCDLVEIEDGVSLLMNSSESMIFIYIYIYILYYIYYLRNELYFLCQILDKIFVSSIMLYGMCRMKWCFAVFYKYMWAKFVCTIQWQRYIVYFFIVYTIS